MAYNKPTYGWSEMSAAELKKIPLPDRFLCRECKKFKSPPQFSNKQCNDYRFKMHTRQRVSNISAKLRCRNCTGDQTQELLCTGPCALWKGLEDFSKNQRRRPENAWCVSCTQWKEANEPGVTPMAPPNNLLSPDEEREVVETEAGFGAYTIDDIEGEADSDDEGVGFIYNSLATTSIADNGIPGSNGRHDKASDTNATLPGYLIASKKTPSVLKTASSLSNPYETRSDFTGEGGKQQSVNTRSGYYFLGNTTKDKAQPNSGGTGSSALDSKRPKTGIPYNAWDNLGQVHGQYRAPPQSMALTGSTGIPGQPDAQSASSGLAGRWSRQNPNRPVAQPASSGHTGAWPKPTGPTRNPPPQFPALGRPVKQNIYDDDDDSPDEI